MKIRLSFLLFVFSCLFGISSFADTLYSDENGLRCRDDNGNDVTGWYWDVVNGPWFYFDADGYAHHEWLVDNGAIYYLRPEDGTMVAACTTSISGGVWQFDSTGAAHRLPDSYTGWLLDRVGWYYRLADGSYVTNGWKQINGETYYFDETGYMKTGLLEVDGKVYYLDEVSGAMAHDVQRTVGGVTYTFDSSGAAAWPYKPITQVAPEQEEMWQTVSAMADTILAGIVNDSMTDRQKAEAIYAWVRGNFTYSGHAATRDWVQEAYNGFRRRHGDCFIYYSVSAALLMRCGIPCIEMLRYTDNGHYWNLVQLSDGNWYHFDATPRRAGGYFCLWTDAQMQDYSAKHGNCFAFDRSLYPRTP